MQFPYLDTLPSTPCLNITWETSITDQWMSYKAANDFAPKLDFRFACFSKSRCSSVLLAQLCWLHCALSPFYFPRHSGACAARLHQYAISWFETLSAVHWHRLLRLIWLCNSPGQLFSTVKHGLSGCRLYIIDCFATCLRGHPITWCQNYFWWFSFQSIGICICICMVVVAYNVG